MAFGNAKQLQLDDGCPIAAIWWLVMVGILIQLSSVESRLRELYRNAALLDLYGFSPLSVRRRGGKIAEAMPLTRVSAPEAK